MKEFIGAFVTVLVMLMVAATSEARGGKAPHKIPHSHKHKTANRCQAKGTWTPGCQ